MRRQPRLAPTALIACLLATAATTASSQSASEFQSKYSEERDNDDGGAPSSEAAANDAAGDDTTNEMCSLYLAPSASSLNTQGTQHGSSAGTSSHPLLGVYAGVDLPPHTPLGHTDLVIPIVEIWSHLMHHYGSSPLPSSPATSSDELSSSELTARDALDVISTGHHSLDYHMSDLLWEPRHFGGVFSGQGYDSKALAPGLGSLVAGGEERDMTNVAHGRVRHQREGVGREDPTAGSFTYYHDLSTYTTKPINAGDELYENFGQHYYADRQGRQAGQGHHQPASASLEDGGAASASSASSDATAASRGGSSNDSQGAHHQGVNIEDIVKKDHKAAGGGFGFMSGLWGVVQDSPIGNVVPKVFQRRDANTGDDDEDADDVNEEESVDAAEAAPSPNVGGGHHPPEWLSQHGRCLDNVYPAESNLDGAGRGAFAARPIASGAIIGPAPVVHIPDRSLLDIREPLPPSAEDGMSDAALLSDTVVGKQLLLNYCLGHNTSTMLLCNVGVGTGYINHASSRGGYGSTTMEPNAKLQWSDLQNSTWLEMTPEELDGQRTLGLMLEYVATRDIAPGEEILIDYGREWEEAWEDHVARWNPQPGSERYRDAADLNDELMDSPVLTVGEQRDDPYPATVETSCYYHYVPGTDEQEAEDDGESSSPRIVQRTWMAGMDTEGTNLRSCRILKRIEYENGVEEYTVRVLNNDETHHSALVPDDERLVVTNVPRHAITFTDRMYTTDQHLPNAFRHEAMIPDEIMPENWKNKDV